jgi:hypothetical protein
MRFPLRALFVAHALTPLVLLLLTACAAATPPPAEAPGYAAPAQAMPGMPPPPEAMPAPMPAQPPPSQAMPMSEAPEMADELGAVDAGPAPVAPASQPMAAAPGRPPAVAQAKPPSAPQARPAKGLAPAPAGKQPPGNAAGKEAAPQQKAPTPMLIYTGQLGMETDDQASIPATLDKVIDLAESFGGYLAARTDTNVQVRVPSQRFREALTALEKVGKVVRRSVSAEDVSEQYHDLEVRLSNLKAVQKRLQEFLARAQNITDALTVERELERIGREIDQIEGRMRFLRARASFSLMTVDVAFRPKATATAVGGEPPPPPPRAVDLPISWIPKVGLSSLMNLRSTGD